jgi:hypothetical protein
MKRTLATAVCSAVASTLITLAAVGAVRPTHVDAQPQVRRAAGFEVSGRHGEVSGFFGSDQDGTVRLELNDERGQPRIQLRYGGGAPGGLATISIYGYAPPPSPQQAPVLVWQAP